MGGTRSKRSAPDQEIAVYRVAQEALANVARHSNATQVKVDLDTSGASLELRVRDDGKGFDSILRRKGLGLDGMAERARLVGGELKIDARPGTGTELVRRVP